MSLIEIEYGALASSRVLNDNFRYLQSLIEDVNSVTQGFTAQVATLNTSVSNVLSYRESFIGVGMILPYTASTLPDGYLYCDGSEVSIEDYSDLYDVIGRTYGSTDSTTFCIPDLTDKTLWGSGENSVGEYLSSKLPNIKGQFRLQGTEGAASVLGAFKIGSKGGSWGSGHDNSALNPLVQFDASLYSNIYDDDSQIVQPPALTVKFIIKY